jgi:hypothetical protein
VVAFEDEAEGPFRLQPSNLSPDLRAQRLVLDAAQEHI